MYKRFVKILLIFSSVTLAIFIGIWVLAITDGTKEVKELKNDLNGEKIYLIKQSWGLGDTKMSIGLNKRLRAGFKNKPKNKYIETVGTEFIFYKFDHGKLIIYCDSFKEPIENNFITDIEFVGLTNPEFIKLGQDKNYEKKGLNIFPESAIRRLNYVDSLKNAK